MRHAVVAVAVLFVVAAIVLSTPTKVVSQYSSPVRVVNTTTQPVPTAPQGVTPVSGNVDVSGMVDIGRMPRVTVGAMPPVDVAMLPPVNVASLPATVDSPLQVTDLYKARHAVQASCTLEIRDGWGGGIGQSGTCDPAYTLPAGKRLVITNVSFWGYLPQDQFFVLVRLGVYNAGGAWRSAAYVVPTLIGSYNGANVYAANLPLFAVNDGSEFEVYAGRSGSSGGGSASFLVSGYTIDCGSGGCQ